MKKIIIIHYSLLIAALLLCGTVFAKDQSIAYVDLQYILQPFPDAVATSFVSVILLALLYKLEKHVFHGITPRAITSISRNVNRYYCTSYMFILPLQTIFVAVFGGLPENEIAPFLVSVAITVLCVLVIGVYEKTLAGPVQHTKPVTKLCVYAAVWILTFLIVAYVYPKLDVFPNIWNNYLLDEVGKGGVL